MKKILCILTILVLSMSMFFEASAASIIDYSTDYLSGWKRYDNGCHMSKKTTSYSYYADTPDNLNLLISRYKNVFEEGINMWDSHINMQNDDWNPTDGKIKYYNNPNMMFYAEAVYADTDDDGDVDVWHININDPRIAGQLYSDQIIILAHEIGHIYGLDHYNYEYDGVYACVHDGSVDPNFYPVTNQEKKAMDFLTHEHTTHTWSLESSDAYNHTRRCTDCRVLKKDPHTLSAPYTSYDSNTHSATCSICGNTGRENHTWGSPSSIGNYSHKYTCTKCDYVKYDNHTGTYSNYNDTQHRAYCSICQSYYYENHYYSSNCDSTCDRSGCSYTRTPPHLWGATQWGAHPHPGTQSCTGSGCNATQFVGYYDGKYPNCNTCYPPHTHTWGPTQWSATHPHPGTQTCTGSGCNATQSVGNYSGKYSGCTTCYPPHTHTWGSTQWSDTHPHPGTQTCTGCNATQSVGNYSGKYSGCTTCNPPHTHTYSPACAANCSTCGAYRGAQHSYSAETWQSVATAGVCRRKVKYCIYCYVNVVTDTDYNHFFYGNLCGKCGYKRT